MDHNPGSATAATATDLDVFDRDNVAGIAVDLDVAVARAIAVADAGSSAVAANPGDNGSHAAVAHSASYPCASCYCCDCYCRDRNVHLYYGRDRYGRRGLPAAVAGSANALRVPATGGSVPVVAVPNAAAVPGYC